MLPAPSCGAREAAGPCAAEAGYLGKPAVALLLRRLAEEKPADLQAFLRAFAEDLLPHNAHLRRGSSGSSHVLRAGEEWAQEEEVEDLYELLDWRFFILNKEKEIVDKSKRVLQGSLDRSYEPAPFHFQSFVPRVIADSMTRGQISMVDATHIINATPIRSTYNPRVATFDAVVVFADASGFTAMTETLAERPHGAEEIGACLNDFFDPLIELVIGFGGDVLKFSGDAITVLWRVPDARAEDPEGAEAAATAAAAAACRCCLDVQSKVASFGHTPVPGITLTLHIGMGFGRLSVLQLGGVLDRWEYCAVGPPLEEVAHGEELARPGETVLSPSVRSLLARGGAEGGFRFEPVAQVEGRPDGYVLLLGADSDAGGTVTQQRHVRLSRRATLVPMATIDLRLVCRFIPKAVFMHLSSRNSEVDAEMRRVAVIFISIRGLDPGIREEDARRTQMLMRLFQRSCYALEGSVNKFLVDDKGMLLLAVFGLPPMNHYSDDPLRAVLAACRFCDSLREEGIHGRAGVATGPCWCGIMGSRLRREYTVLGNVVNLSARLMAKAENDTVLVDVVTREACKGFLEFESLGEFSFKGKANLVPVFRFTGQVVPRSVQKQTQLQSPLLRWEGWPVKSKVHRALQAQLKHQEGPGGIVYLMGGPGSGKTQAAEIVKAWAASKGYVVLSGQNMNPTSTFAVPRLVWQEVFGALIARACADPYWQARVYGGSPLNGGNVSPGRSPKLYQLVRAMLSDAEKDIMSWAPLLSFVVPGLNFGAKGVSALLERDEQRTSGTPRLAELCSLVLEAFVGNSTGFAGTVVVVHMKRGTSLNHETYSHDGHIMRAIGDLCLSRRAAAAEPGGKPLILCVVSRTKELQDETLLEHTKALKGVVPLDDLGFEDTHGYLAQLLAAPGGVDDRIVEHVYEVCGGNPMSIELVAKQLQDLGVLQRGPNDVVGPAPGWESPERLQEMPYLEDLKGLQLATFEKLEPVEQLLLKTAAVGSTREFRVSVVAQSLGIATNREVEERCLRLTSQGILRPARNRRHIASTDGLEMSPGLSLFTFTSAVMRHVAATLVLQVQKDKINKSMSGSIYRSPSGSLSLVG